MLFTLKSYHFAFAGCLPSTCCRTEVFLFENLFPRFRGKEGNAISTCFLMQLKL